MTTRAEHMAKLLEVFRGSAAFLLTSHARPDGDAIGSLLALASLLDGIGCRSDIVLADPIPRIYRTLPRVDLIRHAASVGSPDAAEGLPCILLECDSIERSGLGGLDDGRTLINIDHHASGRSFGSVNWIDPAACAVGVMVYDLAVAAGVEITPAMATCLYTAMISDTGAFTYGGTTAETFALASDLARRGARPVDVARDIYFSNSESKVRLLGAALSNMQCEGAVAWSWVTLEEMDRVGAGVEDCEGVVNYLIGISGVESAVFLRELEVSSQYRLSIRSKGRVDVARVAESFGGGGHRTASGCTLDGPLPLAAERILTQLRLGLC